MDAFFLSPIEWVVILTSLTSGAIGALGIGSYLYWRDRTRHQRHHARQERHLERLQRLTSKLLNALDHLVGGASPEDTILYQWFKALGGEYYADIQSTVYEALRDCQAALIAAFDLHQKLVDPAAANRSMEQRLRDWELLYATLTGSSEQIQNLTGDELGTLLDPLLDPKVEPQSSELAAPLDELRRELAGQPLKVRWVQLDPTQLETDGMLDTVHQLKTQLAQLAERHKKEAPFWLVEARTQRRQAEADIPVFLPELYHYLTRGLSQVTHPTQLNSEQLFRDIDMRLAETEAAQTMGRSLEVIERSHSIWQDMDILRGFLRAMSEYGRRMVRLEAITAQGYAPPRLAKNLQELKVDVQTITGRFHAGDYLGASPWIEELKTDNQRVLAEAIAWRALHHQNVAGLDQLRTKVAGLTAWWQDKVAPAWEQLQHYARPNWSKLVAEVEQARQTFQQLQQAQCDQIESLNSLDVQKLPEAERLLACVAVDLAMVEQQYQAILNRLAEVQAAELNLPEALRLTEADLRRAETLRDQEDSKIGPEVDRQIEQARQHLTEAQRLTGAGEFLAAVNEQFTARQFATAAYVSADEQVREINARQTQLETLAGRVETKIERCLTEVQQMSAVVQTVSTGQLIRQLEESRLEAEQARLAAAGLEDRVLARALTTTIAAYEQVDRRAEWVGRQISADQAEYEETLNRTLALISEAEAAIEQARQAIGEAQANSVGQHALRRAEAMLPARADAEQAARPALERLGEQAESAIRYARWAESQLHWHSRLTRAKHHLHQPEPEHDQQPRLRRLSERHEKSEAVATVD